MLQKGKESIACSRLSDSEKDARVKDTRKYERVRKEKGTVAGKIRGRRNERRDFLPFYFRVRAFSISRTRLYLGASESFAQFSVRV